MTWIQSDGKPEEGAIVDVFVPGRGRITDVTFVGGKFMDTFDDDEAWSGWREYEVFPSHWMIAPKDPVVIEIDTFVSKEYPEKIKDMLSSGNYEQSRKFLYGLLAFHSNNEYLTEKQRNCVDNCHMDSRGCDGIDQEDEQDGLDFFPGDPMDYGDR